MKLTYKVLLSSLNFVMELYCKLLRYLQARSYLNNMRRCSEEFLEQLNQKTIHKFPPLRFLLQIDVMDVYDLMPILGDLLIKEPLKWQYMCNDILYACFKSIDGEMVEHVKPAQVAVTLRLTSLSQYLLNSQSCRSLIFVSGLLTSISKPTSYVYHTVWSCPEECEENEVILNYIPKIAPKCYLCKSNLYENSGFRRCGERLKATFHIKNSLCMNFDIVDDLIPLLALGKRYILIAVVLKKTTIVWSLEETNTLLAPITVIIPSEIKELFDICDGLPWKFIYCLAGTIGARNAPMNCFMHAKINLLLSLTSVKANILTGSAILHILAAGHDTGYIGNLMKQAAQLADRHILLGNSVSSAATSLIGSSGGVCVMSLPLHCYKQKLTYDILSAIETGEISANNYKIQCAVWAQGMDFKKIVLYNVASIFGYVTRGDYGEYSEELSDFLLEQAIEPNKISVEEIQTMKDIALYIDLIAGLDVILEKTTEDLLTNYFLAARKERPKVLNVGSMKSLVSICMMSAKLCRRKVTHVQDAVFAIWLHISGIPEPRFAPEEYLCTPNDIKKLHVMMTNFIEWLEHFIGHEINP